jgi:hypothetical protein
MSTVRVVVGGGDEHRLRPNVRISCGAMGQEGIVAIGPQVRVERFDALIG